MTFLIYCHTIFVTLYCLLVTVLSVYLIAMSKCLSKMKMKIFTIKCASRFAIKSAVRKFTDKGNETNRKLFCRLQMNTPNLQQAKTWSFQIYKFYPKVNFFGLFFCNHFHSTMTVFGMKVSISVLCHVAVNLLHLCCLLMNIHLLVTESLMHVFV